MDNSLVEEQQKMENKCRRTVALKIVITFFLHRNRDFDYYSSLLFRLKQNDYDYCNFIFRNRLS